MQAAFGSLRRIVHAGLIITLIAIGFAAGSIASASENAPPQPSAPPATEPTAAPPIGPAPLSLTKQASTDTIAPGQTFSFTVEVSASQDRSHVQVRDTLDDQIEVVSIQSTAGTCDKAGVACSVSVGANKPAIITIVARVRPGATPGTRLAGQASAQDELSFTAASERVSILVASPATPANPTDTQKQTPSNRREKRSAPADTPVQAPLPQQSSLPNERAAREIVEPPAIPVAAPLPAVAGAEPISWLDLAPVGR